jgi:undecaprenyl-diphosphatase
MPLFTKILILAVVQGVTEFLPVSSSGHLVLAQHVLKFEAPAMTFDIALHFGTLLSVLIFYRKRITVLITGLLKWERETTRYAGALIAASLPAGIIGVLFKDRFEQTFNSPAKVAVFLMVTGVILLSLLLARRSDKKIGILNSLLIGIAQAVAILPGISRSGSTIVAARHMGIKPDEAAEFSFFLMIPAVGGASVLELVHHGANAGGIALMPLLVGVGVSAFVGYFAIALLVRALRSNLCWLFGVYCLVVGLVSLWLL